MTHILVFGAGGRAGRAVLAEALSRDHSATAAVRDTTVHADLTTTGARLVTADATDADHVAAVAPGHDVVVNATRPTGNNRTDHFTRMNETLLNGLETAGVPRLVLIGGAGTLETVDGTQFVDTPDFPDSAKPRGLAQRDALHDLQARETVIDWSYLVPAPRFIPDGERTGTYRITRSPKLADLTHTDISYADFAVGLVDEIETARHLRTPITLTSEPEI